MDISIWGYLAFLLALVYQATGYQMCCYDDVPSDINDFFDPVDLSNNPALQRLSERNGTLRSSSWYKDNLPFPTQGSPDLVRMVQEYREGTLTRSLDEEELKRVKFAHEVDYPAIAEFLENYTEEEGSEILELAAKAVEESENKYRSTRASYTYQRCDNTTARLFHAFKKSDPESIRLSVLGFITEKATSILQERYQLSSRSLAALRNLGGINGCDKYDANYGLPALNCDEFNPFRSMNGSCNNLDNPHWGQSFTPYDRINLAAYHKNSTKKFRRATDCGPLPNARKISEIINTGISSHSKEYNLLHIAFGQLLDHDLTLTPISTENGAPIDCCFKPACKRHSECKSIPIKGYDIFYRGSSNKCMGFMRSLPINPDCTYGPRDQINEQTAFLDASVIYDVTIDKSGKLRTFADGLLKTQTTSNGHTLLPTVNADHDCNIDPSLFPGMKCFKAGDPRANEQPVLTFYQTLFVREHNRVAGILKNLNGHWDDERLFQETRRIVGAELQHIAYNEFVPTFIGKTLTEASFLEPKAYNGYDKNINSGIANVFAAAAYRVGHTMVSGTVPLDFETSSTPLEVKRLSDMFFDPHTFYNKEKDAMLGFARGASSFAEEEMDTTFSYDLSGLLFKGGGGHGQRYGGDIFAINIQRGRDHGIAPYNEWRDLCGFGKADTFDDMTDLMSQENVDKLKLVYTDVNDIDLFVAGVSENPITDGLVGHTFGCLIRDQFLRIKYGDRFWYENQKENPGKFSHDQLDAIYNVTLARVLCNNIEELHDTQRWSARLPSKTNPKVCCDHIMKYGFDEWKETIGI